MMGQITIVFTKERWGFISHLVRWAVPRSRFALGLSSHCVIANNVNKDVYDTLISTGVRKLPLEESIRGSIIVRQLTYIVPDIEAALKFADEQLGKPYDKKGALGLGINPERNWAEDDAWFCYELAAAILKAGGLDIFRNISHVTETALFCIK